MRTTVLYTVESDQSIGRATADLKVSDPTPEQATAVMNAAFPAPFSHEAKPNNGQEISQGVCPPVEDDD